MTDAKLQKAREAALKAQRELEALEAAEAEKAAKLAAEREGRAREYDRDFLGGWQALAAEVATVERDADTYDPATMGFLEGVIRLAAAREKRRYVLQAAQSAEATMGIPSSHSTVPESRPYALDVLGHITGIIEREAARRAGEFADELDAKREAYVNGSEA
ncbi:hypothetical protein [Streptomyces olivaceoviridis]|uniref:hypothetical protein n=1 Tax=Streptomyces olivaceoviridis TaxID=1921 RepID=UPI00379F5D41